MLACLPAEAVVSYPLRPRACERGRTAAVQAATRKGDVMQQTPSDYARARAAFLAMRRAEESAEPDEVKAAQDAYRIAWQDYARAFTTDANETSIVDALKVAADDAYAAGYAAGRAAGLEQGRGPCDYCHDNPTFGPTGDACPLCGRTWGVPTADEYERLAAEAADEVPCDRACDAYLDLRQAGTSGTPRFALEDVVTCDGCGKPMLPNLSTEDEDGLGWSCTTFGCGDFAGEQIEAEDLVACGCPAWVAERLASLSDACADLMDVEGIRHEPRDDEPHGLYDRQPWRGQPCALCGVPLQPDDDEHGVMPYGAGHAHASCAGAEAWTPCPVCGGEGESLGSLGGRVHYRCRACGMEYSRKGTS